MKIAIVTGASSGMGREFVLQLPGYVRVDEIWAVARRKDALEKATAVFFYNLTLAVTGAVLIMLIQPLPLEDVLFETFSASATVGLSLGLTPLLSTASKIVVMILMFFGRVGILTIATLLSDKEVREKNQMQYADTHLMIG